jgi:hypothetical protein
MTAKSASIIDKLKVIFKEKSSSPADEPTVFLYGDDERYAINMTIKNSFAAPNTDETDTPLDALFWEDKWRARVGNGNITASNATDFDELCLAYGTRGAKALWEQMSHPTRGAAVSIKTIEASEAADFEALVANQEKNLKALEAAYLAHEKIKEFWI